MSDFLDFFFYSLSAIAGGSRSLLILAFSLFAFLTVYMFIRRFLQNVI